MKKFIATILLVVLTLVGCTAMAEGWMIADGGQSNVRVAPDINSQSIGVIHEGDMIYVVNKIHTKDGRTWCQVDWYGRDAYISDRYMSDYVEEIYEYYDEDDSYEYNASLAQFEFILTGDAHVRSWADVSATSLGIITKGTHVFGTMLYASDDGKVWLEVQMSTGDFGYISTKNLRLTSGTLPKFGKYMVVTGEQVNVREDSDIDSRIVANLHKGDVVEPEFYVCTADGRIWAYCYQNTYPIGYVSCRYLTAK